jgi:hypothetical protein
VARVGHYHQLRAGHRTGDQPSLRWPADQNEGPHQDQRWAVDLREQCTRKIMLAYLGYAESFVKQGATWLFAERNLYLEFSDTRTLGG